MTDGSEDTRDSLPVYGSDSTLSGATPVWDAAWRSMQSHDPHSTLPVAAPVSDAADDSINALPALIEFPGRYREVRLCGQGGGGRVLMVFDEHLRRDVAMKQLLRMPGGSSASTHMSPGMPSAPVLTRFLREARVTSQLEHPSIVPVYELGCSKDGLPYYTMKLVRGRTLSRAIREANGLPERLRLLPHVVDLCQAIGYAHSKGVIHRDLKPNNVMVGEFGETVVLDWGLAKVRGQRDIYRGALERKATSWTSQDDASPETMLGEVLGTPGYMAPEQALGLVDQINERTDIYALGAVLYTVLTGAAPFRAAGHQEVIRELLEEEPVPPERLEATLPTELAAICRRAMAKEAEARYASAMELADELQRFQAGALVQAHHYGPWERFGRFVKRHRAVFATASVALGFLVLAALLFVGRIVQEKNQTRYALYRASISLAQQAADNSNLHEAGQSLFNAPEQERGFEWGMLAYQSNESLVSFSRPPGGSLHPQFSPDGNRVATPGHNGTIPIWDFRTAKEILTLKDSTNPITEVAFSPDGIRLAACCSDGAIRIWDSITGEKIRTISAHKKPIANLAFAPDGIRLASVAEDPKIKIWDSTNARLLHEFSLEGCADVRDVAFSPDGLRLAACGTSGKCGVWDMDSGNFLFNLTGHTAVVESVAFSPDGQTLATTSRDNTVKLWDLVTGKERLTLSGHTGPVFKTRFLQGGKQIASAAQDNTLRVWDTTSGALLEQYIGFSRPLIHFDVTPDERYWLTEQCGDHTGIRPRTPFNQPLRLREHTGPVGALAFNSDGTQLASGAGGWDTLNDRRVILWNTRTGQKDAILEGHTGSVTAVAFLDKDRRLLSCGADRRILLWDLETRQRIREYKGPDGQIRTLAVVPDGKSFLTAGWDTGNKAILWDTETGAQIRTFPATTSLTPSPWTPRGKPQPPEAATVACGFGMSNRENCGTLLK